MTEIAEAKAAARRAAFERRKAAKATDAAAGGALTEAALAVLGRALAGLSPGSAVSGYMAIRTELDPLPAMVALHAAGHRIALPVIVAAGAPLRFRAWVPGAPLVEGPFGARIPAEGDWLAPAALIVPLVAFDRGLRRLGYGGGFYDRTLAELRAAGPVRAIGLAYAAQEAPALPAEPTDARLDGVATEAGLLA